MYRSLITIAAVVSVAAPARAEPQVLDVEASADWVHEATGVRFPARLNGLARDRIVSYLPDENNLGSTYFSSDNDEVLSIYVYRSGSYDVSMMADAAIAAMSANERLGAIDRVSAIFSTFGDAAIGEASGISTSFAVDGAYRSTGIALFRNGNWLVKLRMSSKSVGADVLDRRLGMLASGLAIEPPGQTAPPAYRIGQCGDIPQRGEVARRKLDMSDWIIATTAVSVSYDETIEKDVQDEIAPQQTALLCRDRKSQTGRMYYREAESGEPRAIVFGDSGTVAHAGAAGFSLGEDTSLPIILSLGNGMRTEFFAGFESHPGFAQMLRTIEEGAVQASVVRNGDGSKITLHTVD